MIKMMEFIGANASILVWIILYDGWKNERERSSSCSCQLP
jgi:hypothetical protein